MGKNDFFGDGRSDIILQNADGSVVLWDMSGTSHCRCRTCGQSRRELERRGHGRRHSHHTWRPAPSPMLRGRSSPFQPLASRQENGSPLALGGGTAKLVYYDGVVYGQDVATGRLVYLGRRRLLVQIGCTWFLRRR